MGVGSVSREGQKGYSITRGQREVMIIKMFLKSFKMGIYILKVLKDEQGHFLPKT